MRSTRIRNCRGNNSDDSSDVLVRFIIMQSRPLRFLDQFDVRKSIFGKSAQDADIRYVEFICFVYKWYSCSSFFAAKNQITKG